VKKVEALESSAETGEGEMEEDEDDAVVVVVSDDDALLLNTQEINLNPLLVAKHWPTGNSLYRIPFESNEYVRFPSHRLIRGPNPVKMDTSLRREREGSSFSTVHAALE
jgi:hypothetical protein